VSSLCAQVNAIDDVYTVFDNENTYGNLAQNDVLPAGQVAVFSIIEGPEAGTFSFTTGGNFIYTPPLNEFSWGNVTVSDSITIRFA
jgi:hypothetical protein